MTEQQPVISIGTSETVERVVRTGAQVLSPALILQGFAVFDIWHPTADQTQWFMAMSATCLALAQNLFERRRNRKLIGRPVSAPLGAA